MKQKLLLIMLLISLNVFATEISFTILVGSGNHRYVNRMLVNEFEKANPDIKVKLLETSNARYHNYIQEKKFLQHDVVWWFAGYQLKEMAEQDLLEPLTNIWDENNLYDKFGLKNENISFDGEIYAVPISYYHWGFYYSKPIFDKLNLKEPKTWDEFIVVCETLKKNGIKPFSAGIKDNWTASSWFSYLNLRLNGLKFHLDLLAGKESFKDKRVKKIFEMWKLLLDRDYFINQMGEYDWNTAIPYIYRKKAAMMLIGNFLFVQTSKKVTNDMGFFKFPIINQSVPLYEERPTDILFINKNSKNKDAAKRFLLFMTDSEIQNKFNNPQGYISPNKYSENSEQLFVKSGKEIFDTAEGFSQYFDRDTSKLMAESSFEIFGDFMRNPNIEKAMNKLEEARGKYLK